MKFNNEKLYQYENNFLQIGKPEPKIVYLKLNVDQYREEKPISKDVREKTNENIDFRKNKNEMQEMSLNNEKKINSNNNNNFIANNKVTAIKSSVVFRKETKINEKINEKKIRDDIKLLENEIKKEESEKQKEFFDLQGKLMSKIIEKTQKPQSANFKTNKDNISNVFIFYFPHNFNYFFASIRKNKKIHSKF